ncbi:hypothetical protein [Halobacillus sp. BBL2006]|uniref:hypothetical protein n=1 Tax=Halobacillus sp. BBL2006 TaxID=1543706 RepID=UPI0005423920|nr:hypothetical protein [Halobacillus sp. BBL2006]KHE72875.1 hypothetical protein LD39_02255 [Halobacillus sp. BBL2006]
MENVLMEYGTEQNHLGWLFVAVAVILIGIVVIVAISKKKIDLPKNQMDTFLYSAWAFVLLGALSGVFLLFDAANNEAKNDNAMKNWSSNEGYYVESYGTVKERVNETTIKVENSDSSVVEKEVDQIINGCDKEVYAELTNGQVWLCEE